jgi:hypothetical protein
MKTLDDDESTDYAYPRVGRDDIGMLSSGAKIKIYAPHVAPRLFSSLVGAKVRCKRLHWPFDP